MHERMCVYLYVSMYVCLYVCMNVCMYVCMYVCVYTSMYIHAVCTIVHICMYTRLTVALHRLHHLRKDVYAAYNNTKHWSSWCCCDIVVVTQGNQASCVQLTEQWCSNLWSMDRDRMSQCRSLFDGHALHEFCTACAIRKQITDWDSLHIDVVQDCCI